MTYKNLGYDENTGQVMVEFANPHGGEATTRGVNPVLDENGTDIDKPLTIERIEAVERGVNHKQKLAADKLPKPKAKHAQNVAARIKTMGKYKRPVVKPDITVSKKTSG